MSEDFVSTSDDVARQPTASNISWTELGIGLGVIGGCMIFGAIFAVVCLCKKRKHIKRQDSTYLGYQKSLDHRSNISILGNPDESAPHTSKKSVKDNTVLWMDSNMNIVATRTKKGLEGDDSHIEKSGMESVFESPSEIERIKHALKHDLVSNVGTQKSSLRKINSVHLNQARQYLNPSVNGSICNLLVENESVANDFSPCVNNFSINSNNNSSINSKTIFSINSKNNSSINSKNINFSIGSKSLQSAEEVSDFPSPQEVPQEMHLSQMEEHRLRASTIEKLETSFTRILVTDSYADLSFSRMLAEEKEKEEIMSTVLVNVEEPTESEFESDFVNAKRPSAPMKAKRTERLQSTGSIASTYIAADSLEEGPRTRAPSINLADKSAIKKVLDEVEEAVGFDQNEISTILDGFDIDGIETEEKKSRLGFDNSPRSNSKLVTTGLQLFLDLAQSQPDYAQRQSETQQPLSDFEQRQSESQQQPSETQQQQSDFAQKQSGFQQPQPDCAQLQSETQQQQPETQQQQSYFAQRQSESQQPQPDSAQWQSETQQQQPDFAQRQSETQQQPSDTRQRQKSDNEHKLTQVTSASPISELYSGVPDGAGTLPQVDDDLPKAGNDAIPQADCDDLPQADGDDLHKAADDDQVGLPEPAITKPPHDDGSPEISKLVGHSAAFPLLETPAGRFRKQISGKSADSVGKISSSGRHNGGKECTPRLRRQGTPRTPIRANTPIKSVEVDIHSGEKNIGSLEITSGRDRKLELQYSPVYNAWDGSPAKSCRGPHFGMPTPVKTDGIHDPKPEDKAVVSVDDAKVPEVCVRQETPVRRVSKLDLNDEPVRRVSELDQRDVPVQQGSELNQGDVPVRRGRGLKLDLESCSNLLQWDDKYEELKTQEKDLKLVLTPVAKKAKEFDKPWTPLQINESNLLSPEPLEEINLTKSSHNSSKSSHDISKSSLNSSKSKGPLHDNSMQWDESCDGLEMSCDGLEVSGANLEVSTDGLDDFLASLQTSTGLKPGAANLEASGSSLLSGRSRLNSVDYFTAEEILN